MLNSFSCTLEKNIFSNATRFHYLPGTSLSNQLPQTVIHGKFSTCIHWHKIRQNLVDEWFNFRNPKTKLTHGSVSRHNQRLAQFLSTVNLLPAIFLFHFSFTVRENLVRIFAFCMTGCWRTNTPRLDRFFFLCVLPKGGRPNDTETRINICRMARRSRYSKLIVERVWNSQVIQLSVKNAKSLIKIVPALRKKYKILSLP